MTHVTTVAVSRDRGLLDLLPLSLEDPDEGCIRPSEDVFCFRTGDPRVNEQTVLCMLHTLMIRNHNLMARQLAGLNPHWSDETIFQETRHINVALFQHITFNEFLPMVLGKQGLYDHDLVLYTDGYYDGYDASIDPGAAQVSCDWWRPRSSPLIGPGLHHRRLQVRAHAAAEHGGEVDLQPPVPRHAEAVRDAAAAIRPVQGGLVR